MDSGLCSRCGGNLTSSGVCNVCGQDAYSPQAGGPVGVGSGGAGMNSGQAQASNKRAFLFNRITNQRFSLVQSVSKIGRDQTNHIPLTNDHYISRNHAWVLQMQGGYWIEDLGSTNGTMLNGELLRERQQISAGDLLTLGKTELVFIME